MTHAGKKRWAESVAATEEADGARTIFELPFVVTTEAHFTSAHGAFVPFQSFRRCDRR
jgi:hypothetical protein